MKQAFYLLLFPIFLYACSSSKKLSYDDQMANAPEWVKKTPGDPQYYHGIGAASKSAPMDFREKAKQNALSDLAGNISVHISSSSVLSQFEFDNKFSDYYRDNIRLSTKNYLEGYEMVENWETPDRYWVYFRLSKSEYERIRKERIQTALSKSEGDYLEAEKSLSEGNSAEAIYNQIKAIGEIIDFLEEELQSKIIGNGQSYTSRLFADLTSTLQNIRIVFPANSIDVKRGQKPENGNLTVTVQNEKNIHLTGVPVIIAYSFSPGKKDELISDANGTVRIPTGTINSKRKTEYIASMVNFEKMVREATPDPMVRKLLGSIKAIEYVMPVNILPLVFYIDVANSHISEDIKAILTGDGFSIASNRASAGLILSIDANTTTNSAYNGKFSVALIADFMVKDKNGQMIFNQRLTDITGIGTDNESAVTDAINALITRIRISVIPAMYKQAFQD